MWQVKKVLPVFLFATVLTLILLPFYRNGQIISGWEGAYFFDYKNLFQIRSYSWAGEGTGIIWTSLNFAFIFYLLLIQELTHSLRLANFVMIFSLYFLPFVAMYLTARQMKLSLRISFLIGLFYITNPFMSHFMKSINQWNMLAAFIFPAFFYLIYKYYHQSLKLFTFFGIFSLFFAFTNANPPTMILYQMALLFFIPLIAIIKEGKISIVTMISKYIIVTSSFVLFNLWWILNWFMVFSDASAAYTVDLAINSLKIGRFIPMLWRSMNLSGLLEFPQYSTYDYLNFHFSYFFSPLLLALPFLIILVSLFNKKLVQRSHLFLFTAILAVIFLSKGINSPLGKIYELMVVHIPLFNIFKSAREKWGLFLVFLFALYFILILKDPISKFSRLVIILLVVFVGYSSIPFVIGKFLPDYKFNSKVTGSKMYLDKKEYQDLRLKLNTDPLQYRVLSLPGSLNYQVALHIEGDRYYTGNDPVLNNTNKPFLAPYNGSFSRRFMLLFDTISHPDYLRFLPIFNIKKIVINKDMYPWFNFREKENIEKIEEILDRKLTSKKNGVIDLYDLGDYFLPRFYIPTKIIQTNLPLEGLPQLTKGSDYQIRTAYLSQPINITSDVQPPNITFTKINPTKYQVKVENAKSPYLLVFSESFHTNWRAYIQKPQKANRYFSKPVAEYFNGQIKESEIKLPFINSKILETLKQTPLSEAKHLLANWYVNAWTISPEDAGNQENYEIIIEYWPQRFFYLSAGVTLLTFIASLALLIVKSFLKW